MRWSILIPTMEARRHTFDALVANLRDQIADPTQVEILSVCDLGIDNGGPSIGVKRQRMLEMSTADYVCFVDDDDILDAQYVPKILRALESSPDCVCFKVLCDFASGISSAVISNKYKTWASDVDGFDYVRSPNHLGVIKREHALAIGFKDMRFGEDADFSLRMVDAGLLKTEVFIDEYLYTYLKR